MIEQWPQVAAAVGAAALAGIPACAIDKIVIGMSAGIDSPAYVGMSRRHSSTRALAKAETAAK